jgi:phosphatidylglycerophosphate synthase
MKAGYPHPRMGACNAVTLLRAAITAGLTLPLVTPAVPAWGVVGAAAFALQLDGLDGWLARREGLVSAFGARFDMEVDALLALVLALLALAAGKAGPWVLALGGLRYAFVAAGVFLPWLRGDLPPRIGRKTVCVIQIAALIALLAPPVQPPLSLWVAGLATVLLTASFAADILWLWRRR